MSAFVIPALSRNPTSFDENKRKRITIFHMVAYFSTKIMGFRLKARMTDTEN